MKKKVESPHPIDVHVGMRLRMRRNTLGMSQEELGKSVGVTFQQVQKYERGTNRIGSSRLYQFSNILSVPVSFFFEQFSAAGLAEKAGEGFEAEQPPVDRKETSQLMKYFNRIDNPKLRQQVISLVKEMAARG